MKRINYEKLEAAMDREFQKLRLKRDLVEHQRLIDPQAVEFHEKRTFSHERLRYLVRWLSKHVNDLPRLLRVEPDELEALMGSAEKWSQERWEKMFALEAQCVRLKTEIVKQLGEGEDAHLVEQTRKEQKGARLNTPKGWKPL
ncbi:MAG: hypothetical protein KDK40_00270 [Chlamydiia bacterium]|nr:hypothetical protein [Chlamydiia bacterium]